MSHQFRCIRFERHPGATPGADVLEVIIDRPDSAINAINGELHEDLTNLFPRLQAERAARAVLLTGAGRAFSAGGDFTWFPTLDDRTTLENLRIDAKHLIYDLLDVHLPIVCAVNGHAMGLGASIALLCDVIFMARSATIGDPHVRVGIVAGDGGTIAWPLAVGPARAKQYLLTGDPVPAVEAERIGLVNAVVDDADLHATALAFAHRLADGAPLAVQYTKAAVNAAIKAQAMIAFDQAAAFEIATFGTDDHREALAAFRERRQPNFAGR
jgi:enoyl-CoA hydratase